MSDQPTARTEPAEAPASAKSEPLGPAARVDRQVYAIESGMVAGALLIMTMTYFLWIVRREMDAGPGDRAFDKLLLRMSGHSNLTEAPPELVASVSDTWVPLILGVLTFLAGMLAVRTRDRAGLEPGADPPPPRWLKRILVSAIVTAGMFGLLKVIAVVPSQHLCMVALVALVLAAVVGTIRSDQHGGLFAGAIAASGALMASFFAHNVQDDYNWSMELSSVLLMYVGFFGASMATRDDKHIAIDFVRKKISPRYLNLYNAISRLVTILFCVFLLILGLDYLSDQVGHGGYLPSSGLPHYFVSLPISIAFVLMTVRFSARLYTDVRGFLRREVPSGPGTELH